MVSSRLMEDMVISRLMEDMVISRLMDMVQQETPPTGSIRVRIPRGTARDFPRFGAKKNSRKFGNFFPNPFIIMIPIL